MTSVRTAHTSFTEGLDSCFWCLWQVRQRVFAVLKLPRGLLVRVCGYESRRVIVAPLAPGRSSP